MAGGCMGLTSQVAWPSHLLSELQDSGRRLHLKIEAYGARRDGPQAVLWLPHAHTHMYMHKHMNIHNSFLCDSKLKMSNNDHR